MEIKFIGTGGAFDYKYRNSAAIIEMKGKKILIDCGNSIYFTLREKKAIEDIDYILITHFHDDHVGSLASVILHHKHFVDRDQPLTILYQNEEFLQKLKEFLSFPLQNPDDYVKFAPIEKFGGIHAIDTRDMHIPGMQTYGFIFQQEDETIAYSGDLGNPDKIFNEIKNKGIEQATVCHEISFEKGNNAHVYYRDLFKYRENYRIYGYHCDPAKEPSDNLIPLVQNVPELLW